MSSAALPSLPRANPTARPQAGTDCLIGTEIVTYKQVNTSAPFGLTGVTRGAYGTKAATHPAGASVSLLLQIYGGFLPDPATDMIAEIGANMANAYNEAGMDMICELIFLFMSPQCPRLQSLSQLTECYAAAQTSTGSKAWPTAVAHLRLPSRCFTRHSMIT